MASMDSLLLLQDVYMCVALCAVKLTEVVMQVNRLGDCDTEFLSFIETIYLLSLESQPERE